MPTTSAQGTTINAPTSYLIDGPCARRSSPIDDGLGDRLRQQASPHFGVVNLVGMMSHVLGDRGGGIDEDGALLGGETDRVTALNAAMARSRDPVEA